MLAQSSLSCFERTGDIVRPRSADEMRRIRQAPHGVHRPAKRELDVSWSAGTHVFKEQPPYDAELEGVWWAYCGYSQELGLHLIMKGDGDVFGGILLDDKTGRLLPGGETVLFSPNHQRYLAFEQPDGQDGETIKLCTRRGTLLWKGYNGILAADGVSMVAEIKNVHWDKTNQLVAEAHAFEGKTSLVVMLTQGKSGQWQWLPAQKR
jgi:hypothetical protein